MATLSPQLSELQQHSRKARELKQQGWRPGAIAEVLGVTSQTVEQWLKAYPTGGLQSSQLEQFAAPSTALSEEQQRRLLTLLRRLPSDFGFRELHWTAEHIRVLIQQSFDIILPSDALDEVVHWVTTQPEEQAALAKVVGLEASGQRVKLKKQHRIRKLQLWALNQEEQVKPIWADEPELSPEVAPLSRDAAKSKASTIRQGKFKSGPPTKLTIEQLQMLPELLLKPPQAYGLTGNAWTYKQIALMIEQVYQVSFSPDYIPDFLKRARRRLEKFGR